MELLISKVFHRRNFPKVNEFVYSAFFIRFNIDEMVTQLRFFSFDRFNILSFYKKDHGERDGSCLRKWCHKKLKEVGIENFDGKIVLHTLPRVFGFVFNPVSFWYCYDKDEVIAIICEVNNTFSETHSYVLSQTQTRQNKAFYVSPFYAVEGVYEFNFKNQNKISIDYYIQGKKNFETMVSCKQVKLSDLNIIKHNFLNPFMTLKIVILINFQAIKLFLKKIRIVKKPNQEIRTASDEH